MMRSSNSLHAVNTKFKGDHNPCRRRKATASRKVISSSKIAIIWRVDTGDVEIRMRAVDLTTNESLTDKRLRQEATISRKLMLTANGLRRLSEIQRLRRENSNPSPATLGMLASS